MEDFRLQAIGFVESPLTRREDAPRQGNEGAPNAWIKLKEEFLDALDGVEIGQEIIILTWFHQSDRTIHKVHPRGDKKNPIAGVFATRSPDRPNPIGLHEVVVLQINGNEIEVSMLEAIQGTPVIDIKPVI